MEYNYDNVLIVRRRNKKKKGVNNEIKVFAALSKIRGIIMYSL
jgi:hypothetical protein